MIRIRPSGQQSNVFPALLLALAGLVGCDATPNARAANDETSALLVRVERAELEAEYAIEREFIGRVEAAREARVGFELSGLLKRVHVQEGDQVAAGEVLAELDTARLEARLAEAMAGVNQAVSAQRFAEQSLQRSKVAADFEGISTQELDQAVDQANAAQAGTAAAEARQSRVQVDLEKSSLRAPFGATIVARNLDEGQIVSPGEPVLKLLETAAPEVRIGVSGDLAQALAVGDVQQLRLDGKSVDATIRAILPLRDPATRTVDVIFELAGSAALPGDIARLPLRESVADPGFWLPLSALAEGSRGLWIAYVAMPLAGGTIPSGGATHYLEPRAIELLYEDTERVYVRGALSDGEAYVTGGLTRVVPNQQVRIAHAGLAGDATANAP